MVNRNVYTHPNIKNALIDKSKRGEAGSSADEDGQVSEKSIGDADVDVEQQFQLKDLSREAWRSQSKARSSVT